MFSERTGQQDLPAEQVSLQAVFERARPVTGQRCRDGGEEIAALDDQAVAKTRSMAIRQCIRFDASQVAQPIDLQREKVERVGVGYEELDHGRFDEVGEPGVVFGSRVNHPLRRGHDQQMSPSVLAALKPDRASTARTRIRLQWKNTLANSTKISTSSKLLFTSEAHFSTRGTQCAGSLPRSSFRNAETSMSDGPRISATGMPWAMASRAASW